MVHPRRKLPWCWCVSGFCLGIVFFYLFIPVFYFGGSQTTQGHFRSEQVVKEDDIRTLVSLEVNNTFLQDTHNVPEWYGKGNFGLLRKNVNLETISISKEYRVDDNEVNITWSNFFYGTTNGLVLELGALDGKFLSVSRFYEYEAGWRSILIEGNPEMGRVLKKNRPNAISFNTAICEQPKTVHFVKTIGVGGIVEFMTKAFLARLHPYLLTNGKLDEEKLAKAENVVKVPCVPLSHILSPLNISHINFFMLDVEGGELSVLKAIDFEKIKFDVIGVETDWGLESKEVTKIKRDSVIQFLISKGYDLWSRKMGRNSWFKHPDFVAFSKN